MAETPEEMPTLRVCTLLSDDPRRPLRPKDMAYSGALVALEQRDTWGAFEHGACWSVLLPQWPRGGRAGGRPPTTDTLSRVAALLAREGIDPASALHLSPHTLRARGTSDGHRERPSVERGEELLRTERREDYGTMMRRSTGDLWEPDRAAPRVYIDGEPEPELTYFNPLVELGDDHPGADYERLAVEALRARWAQDHADVLPSALPPGLE
jgi:hypothetical protein